MISLTISSIARFITSIFEKLRVALYIDYLAFILKIFRQMSSFSKSKSSIPKVKSELIEPWPEPDANVFPPGKKILWGFWNTGEEGMPPFIKFCIDSWRVNNPDWMIVIISDKNFNKYVSAKEIPSTFRSLKVQHRSDIIRVAALLRYGGVYMDVTTICAKGLDNIMDDEKTPDLLLQPAWVQSNGVPTPNNALFIARKPNNPLLEVFLKRMIAYWENPAVTLEEMKHRSEFKRVMFTTRDPNQGFVAGAEIYCSNLLILTDLLWFGETAEYAKNHVRYLSHWQWSIPDFRPNPEKGLTEKDLRQCPNFKLSYIFPVISSIAKCYTGDDEALATAVYDRLCVMKFSTNLGVDPNATREQLLGVPKTKGRILRKVMDIDKIDQAKLEGMRNIEGDFV